MPRTASENPQAPLWPSVVVLALAVAVFALWPVPYAFVVTCAALGVVAGVCKALWPKSELIGYVVAALTVMAVINARDGALTLMPQSGVSVWHGALFFLTGQALVVFAMRSLRMSVTRAEST